MPGMSVTLLHFVGCPDWREAETRLLEALRVAGRPEEGVTLLALTPREGADRLGVRGSPTILVDGVDPFVEQTAPVGVAGRLVPTSDVSCGAPTVEQLVGALR
jgi:hypothetical protein